jgi:TfoX/Sxy family transcriptional regulator of competence genes
MAYDEDLANRIRSLVLSDPNTVEKKMFGGLAYLVNGNMAVGVHKNDLIVRLSADEYDKALTQPGANMFDLTGKVMKGWLQVEGSAVEDDDALQSWVKVGVDYARTLPAK